MTEHSPSPTSFRPEEVEAMLAVATTGDPSAVSRNPAVQLSQLTPHEIFSVVHTVADADSRMARHSRGELVVVEEIDRRLAEYGDAISDTFDDLAGFIGEEKTRDVFTMLAGSASPADRAYAGLSIGALARIDHDYGLELWKRLLEDDHPEVSGAAWDTARHVYGSIDLDRPEDAKELLARYGLSWNSLTDLIDTYVRQLEALRDQDTPPGERLV